MTQKSSYEELKQFINQLERENTKLKKSNDLLKLKSGKSENRECTIEESEKIFQIIFDHSPLSIMYTDPNGVITTCNERATKMFGAKREKLIGFSYKSIKNERMRRAIADALNGRRSNFEGEYLTVTGNVLTQMSANFSPSFSEDGSVTGVIGIFEDITDRVSAEKSLKELEERFRLAFHTSPDSININKMDGTYVEINEGFTELTGYTREDVIGKSSLDINIWDIPEDRERLIEGLKKDGFIRNLESRFRMKDGSHGIALMSANIIMLQGSPHILSVTKDITRLRETEKAHQELQAHISQVQKLESIGILAGGIAHDFNNLLALILGNIELALVNLASKDISRTLNDAKKASIRAKSLTQQLLTFSKGGDPIKNEASIRDIIEDTTSFILRGSNIKSEYTMPKGLYNVEVDSGQISQVIQNIVINAKEAMPDGGKIDISCQNYTNDLSKIISLPQGEYVKISIKDNGIGIPEDHLKKIFDPYFTTKQQGSGLGLSLSYSIVAKHGGQIFAESKPGKGAAFTFYLPAVQPKEHIERKPPENKNGKAQYSILVMDDEEALRKVAKNMLHHLGHHAVCVADGEQAIKKYKQAKDAETPIDLIIMDLTIPGGMGGKEAVKEILSIDPDAKVLVSSGYSNDPIMANYKAYGFSGAVAKPYELKELMKLVDQVLGADG
jgi:two-component system cell cycle sensor histidine kinase/response regulator CckA